MKIKAMPEQTWKFPKTAGTADLFRVWIVLVHLLILYANLIDAGTTAPKRNRMVRFQQTAMFSGGTASTSGILHSCCLTAFFCVTFNFSWATEMENARLLNLGVNYQGK